MDRRSTRWEPKRSTGIFAHSTDDPTAVDWELLSDHMMAVADLAEEYASRFGAGELARLAAAYHDIGKADPAWQDYLAGRGPQVPHSAMGSRAVLEQVHTPLGKLAAYAICGHHSGLPNGLTASGSGSSSLRDAVGGASRPPSTNWMCPASLSHVPDPLRGIRDEAQLSYALSFLTRMVFSSLVDADRTATASFYGSEPERAFDELAELKRRLCFHLASFSGSEGRVNELRAEVLSAAWGAAEREPGLFTLSVPTGGGKTLSSLAFALDHAIRHGMKRVIYVIPYTSIVEQTADVFRRATGADRAVLEHHSSFDWDGLEASDVPSRRQAAETWDAPIVVTTAVQFYETLHANRTTPCRKLHRMARSVVVIDEAQSMPTHLLRPSLAAISELARGYRSSVVLCTATQPAVMKEDGFRPLEALSRDPSCALPVREIAPDPIDLHRRLKRVRVKDRGIMTDGEVLEEMSQHRQCLVIVNTRRHARDLVDHAEALDGLVHLSTSMTPRHRKAVLEKVRRRLREDRTVRLISTSLIEAGVDVDFPVAYRALAGMDQIAQSAGRCNREGGMDELGVVHVFRPSSARETPKSITPLVEASEKILASHDDPISPEAVNDWFTRVYWGRLDDLDAPRVGCSSRGAVFRGIMEAIRRTGPSLDFPFADIANAYRMIDEDGVDVSIPGDGFGATARGDLLGELSALQSPGAIARKLQLCTVRIPARAALPMLADRTLSAWREGEFGRQFIMLEDEKLYCGVRGLLWDQQKTYSVD